MWRTGWKKSEPDPPPIDPREAKRQKLAAEREARLLRAKLRADKQRLLQKQLAAAEAAQQEAEQVLQEFNNIAEDIFGDFSNEALAVDDVDIDSIDAMAVNFDQEDGTDGEKALDNLRTIHCPYNKEDVDFWFYQLEDQLTLIEVKSQWTKKVALSRFLPIEVQNEVKSLFKIQKANAGNNLYFRIKKEILDLYGSKPEENFARAESRVLTGKPSQLGKLLIEDLCPGDVKLQGCHCNGTVWGMFRKQLPIAIRNHIADMPFTFDTYKEVFTKADQIYDSNKSAEPLPQRQIAAVTTPAANSSSEVAAIQRNQNSQRNRGKNKGQNTQTQNQGQNKNQRQNQAAQGQTGQKPSKSLINEDGHCKIHAKWKSNANFCAAPWGCKMKDIYKAPQ